MPRAYLGLCLVALGLMPGCGPSQCEYQRIVFQYLQTDTSDGLQPGGRAAAGFIPQGNATLGLSALTIVAYAASETVMTAAVYAGSSLSDAPDKGTMVAQGSTTLPATATAPSDPSTSPTVQFQLAAESGTPTLKADGVYFVVLTPATQPVTLGIATAGAYSGSYQTYGTSGWTPSPVSTERVALSLQSPSCD